MSGLIEMCDEIEMISWTSKNSGLKRKLATVQECNAYYNAMLSGPAVAAAKERHKKYAAAVAARAEEKAKEQAALKAEKSAKKTMPCSGCAVVLNVPEGAARFRCPQCAAVNATAAAEAAARGDAQGKIRRVDPKFASGPSSQKQFD